MRWGFAGLDSATLERLDQLANARAAQNWRDSLLTAADDPAVEEIEARLRAAGARTLREVGDHRKPHFVLYRTRIWEKGDLDAADYLRPFIPFSVVDKSHVSGFIEHNTSDVLCVEAKDLPSAGFAGNPETLLCPDSVRRRLEGGSFSHLGFAPVKIMRRTSGPAIFEPVTGHEPWWQLRSDLVLPLMSPAIQRLDPRTGSELPREHAVNVTFREPPFDDFQPRYLRSDWDRVSEFDVAGSNERLIGGGVYHRMLIVSRRFYNFCMQQGWKADWVPVRIDPA